MMHTTTPFERLISNYWGKEPDKLLSLLEDSFRVRVERDQLLHATDVTAFVNSVKNQVDHPGRLERVAERLLRA